MNDEKECVQAVRNMVTDSTRTKGLLESATTVSSSVSEALNSTQKRCTSAPSFEAKTDIKLGKLASEVNFANMMCFDDDDDEINESENQDFEPDNASEPMAAPRLRRFTTEVPEDEVSISNICNSDSPAASCEKFLAHTRSSCK